MLTYFFKQLQEQSHNKQNIVNDFDTYYFTVRPKLSQYHLRQLLFGNLDLSITGGTLSEAKSSFSAMSG